MCQVQRNLPSLTNMITHAVSQSVNAMTKTLTRVLFVHGLKAVNALCGFASADDE